MALCYFLNSSIILYLKKPFEPLWSSEEPWILTDDIIFLKLCHSHAIFFLIRQILTFQKSCFDISPQCVISAWVKIKFLEKEFKYKCISSVLLFNWNKIMYLEIEMFKILKNESKQFCNWINYKIEKLFVINR